MPKYLAISTSGNPDSNSRRMGRVAFACLQKLGADCAWQDKIVGFLCAAGGTASYMSVMAYANSLMLDFRCVIIPRFVFATSDAFDGDKIADKKVTARVEQVANDLVRFTAALRS